MPRRTYRNAPVTSRTTMPVMIARGCGGRAAFAVLALTAIAIACTSTPSQSPPPAGEAFDPAVARRMAIEDLHGRMERGEKVTIVDARASAKGAILPGSVHVPAGDVGPWGKDVPRDTLIVTYCA